MMVAERALEASPEESLDLLAGDWRIFQLKRGHRFSTDDLVTAWRGAKARPDAVSVLDIGSGIGSVGLLTLHALGRAGNSRPTLVGVEAQEQSVGLARRTAAWNHLDGRVEFHHGDLRESSVLPDGVHFDLVTGSPPYVPPGTGLLSPVPQRAACRIELRGSIFDYCAAAYRWLAAGGRFCFVMAAQDPRTEQAPIENGLCVIERWNYVFREGRDPHIATLVCARAEEGPFPARRTGQLLIRDRDGRWTDAYMEFRRDMGVDPGPQARV